VWSADDSSHVVVRATKHSVFFPVPSAVRLSRARRRADIHTQHGRHDNRGHVAATPVDPADSEDIFQQQTDVHDRRRPSADHTAEEMRLSGRDRAAHRPDVHVHGLHDTVSDGHQQEAVRMRPVVLQEDR